MARLLIEAGAISYEQTASNANADRVFTQAALRLGFAGDTSDKQAVVDFVGTQLVQYLVNLARGHEQDAAIDTALTDAAADQPDFAA